MSHLLERVAQAIQSRRLLRRGQAALVAVSGGIDSMALLHLLHELAGAHDWKLSVAHLNHQLRGRSSAADERLVRRTAERLGLRVVTESVPVRKLAAEQGVSIEMAARKARHEFLARTAAKWRIRTIVVAHHLDDQVELFFLRLLRGSGNEGLSGMKPRSQSPADSRTELVRPLLEIPKSDLTEFVRERRIPFREDASNASLDFQRNRIRHELIPLLNRNYQPALTRTICRVMEIAGQESAFVTEAAARWLASGGQEGAFDRLAVAVQRRVIQLQLLKLKMPAGFDLVEALRRKPDVAVSIAPGIAGLRRSDGLVRVEKRANVSSPSKAIVEVNLPEVARVRFGRLELNWRIRAGRSGLIVKSLPGIEIFDADRVGMAVRLRHWRAGDRFRPIGMAGSAKLQDLFTNQRIPRERRGGLVVAESESGEIFWVEGLRISELFKVTEATSRRLEWRWARVDSAENPAENPAVAG